MLYHIESQLDEPIKSWHWNLVKEVASNFPALTWTRDQKLLAHFTLKYKFETDKINELESVLEKFTENHDSATIRVGGFSQFKNETIFVKVNLSPEAHSTFRDLIDSLRKIPWMQWKQYDDMNLHFHMTIAEKCGDRCGEVLKFLAGKERYFDAQFNNISILKLASKDENGMEFWEAYKRYTLNS